MTAYNLVAFTSLPFGLREGTYQCGSPQGPVPVIITESRFNPFVTMAARSLLARPLPHRGQGEGYVSYTWYDHPFVLRVTFGPGVASLGSINSCATIIQRLPESFTLDTLILPSESHEAFAANCLTVFNNIIAIMRRKARLYHLLDLTRADVQLTIRDDSGAIVVDDPLEGRLAQEEEQPASSLDLLDRDDKWYAELAAAMRENNPINLADDLLIEAERALSERLPRQAVASCHTVLETAVSALLTRGMVNRGLTSEAIDDLLQSRSLAAKLDTLLEMYSGYSLKRHNRGLWKSFVALSDLRNDIVHRGYSPDVAQASTALQSTRDILAWLDFVKTRQGPLR